MPNKETIRTLPPYWGDDGLSKFIGMAFRNTLATFANKKPEYAPLVRIDHAFFTACQNLINPQDMLAALLMMRAHSAFRAACQLAMSGQISEAFPVLRSCIEYSLYALHINRAPKVEGEPSLGEVWLRRHDDPAAMQAVRNNFSAGQTQRTLRECDQKLGQIIGDLYDRTIDFGAHPNERAITGSMTMTREDEKTIINQIYLHDDSIHLDHGLKTTAQVGLGSLLIFQQVFRERFQILGINADIDELRNSL